MIKPDNLLSTAKEFSLDENEVILRESIKLSYYYVYHTVYLLLNEKILIAMIKKWVVTNN